MSVARRVVALGTAAGVPLALALGSPVSARQEVPAAPLSTDVAAIDAIGPGDVWAVGAHYLGPWRPKRTVAQHWDGQTWTKVATPNPGRGQNALFSVSGTGADDVWAVGYFWNDNGGPEKLLAEHWDGTTWTSVHVEQPEFAGHHHAQSRLVDVVAIAPDDAWAVGYTFNGGGPGAMTEHWDGSRWSIVPNPHDTSVVTAVAAASSDDVWAGGQGVSWHWDGKRWQSVRGISGSVIDLVAPSPTDGWEVEPDTLRHWNGRSWKAQTPPRPPSAWRALSATSAADVWAVGSDGDYPTLTSVMRHWDGSQWSIATLPRRLRNSSLYGLSADSPVDAWVVGVRGYGGDATEVVGHWDGHQWQVQG